jgi:hypothetical protein
LASPNATQINFDAKSILKIDSRMQKKIKFDFENRVQNQAWASFRPPGGVKEGKVGGPRPKDPM